jgi:tRNA(fMet)-specific endonuclease VapC
MIRRGLDSFFFTIVSFHEEVQGWNAYLNRARDQDGVLRAYAMFQGILTRFARAQVVPYDHDAVEKFEALKRQRLRIGTMDLRIAAIALSNGMTLLSRNLADFRQVPGLVVEDWTA